MVYIIEVSRIPVQICPSLLQSTLSSMDIYVCTHTHTYMLAATDSEEISGVCMCLLAGVVYVRCEFTRCTTTTLDRCE